MNRDIGESPATADEIMAALMTIEPCIVSIKPKDEVSLLYGLSAKAEADASSGRPIEWLSPCLSYHGEGETMRDALSDLWQRLRPLMALNGTLFWRTQPEVESFRDFDTQRSGWRAYCRAGMLATPV